MEGEKKPPAIVLLWVPVEKLALNHALEWSMAITESYSHLQSQPKKDVLSALVFFGNSRKLSYCLEENFAGLGGSIKASQKPFTEARRRICCCRQVTLTSNCKSPHKNLVAIISQYQWLRDYRHYWYTLTSYFIRDTCTPANHVETVQFFITYMQVPVNIYMTHPNECHKEDV